MQTGPFVPLLKWTTKFEIIDRLNATGQARGATVCSDDAPQAQRIAGQLEADTVWMIRVIGIQTAVPFG